MPILKLSPACKGYLWGGTKLKEAYGKEFDGEILAETWELSAHPDGPSQVAAVFGDDALAARLPLSFPEYLALAGRGVLGTDCARFADFPVLIKLIDARRPLSVQVHPDDAQAQALEGGAAVGADGASGGTDGVSGGADGPSAGADGSSAVTGDVSAAQTRFSGKTEAWHVLEAEPGAFLYLGFREPVTEQEFRARIADGTLTEVLNRQEVAPGETYFIPAGTLHAIGAGLVIAEIQQSSNLTYRVFDYGRLGADGKPRALHVEKAVACTRREPPRQFDFGGHLASCEFFTADRFAARDRRIRGAAPFRWFRRPEPYEGVCGPESFVSILVTRGEGTLLCGGCSVPLQKGDSFFLPADSGPFRIDGNAEGVLTTV